MLERLIARLNQPEGFKSYGEIVQWLKDECSVAVDYKTVHQTVHYRLGAKLKVPRPHSTQQDEQAVETLKKTSPLP